MLKLKLQYFGHLLQRANSLEKTLMLGKTEGKEEKGMKDPENGFCHALSNERVTASVRAGLGMPPEGTPVIRVQNEGCGAGNSGDLVLI